MGEQPILVKTDKHIVLYLDAYDRLITNAEFYATLDPPMDEGEQMDAHMAFMQYWGQRHLLGDLYRAGQLTLEQINHLAELDQELLKHAAAVEVAYGPTLGEVLRDLFTWGTPLAEQRGTLRIETTITALAELAQVEPDTRQPAAMQPA